MSTTFTVGAFVIGGLMVLLLFGCAGRTQSPPAPAAPQSPPVAEPSSGVGDSDLSMDEGEDGDILPPEDVLPPPEEMSEQPYPQGSPLDLDDSDLLFDEGDEGSLIGEENIVGPE
ncbi:MAG: hypothetical protein AB1324_08205 [Candidatus Micrarchaeota archaeon]